MKFSEVKYTKSYYKQMLKVSAVYLKKQKSIIPRIQKMALVVLIFSEGFGGFSQPTNDNSAAASCAAT